MGIAEGNGEVEGWVREVTYLRHLVSSRGITNDTEKIKIVKLWPTPSSPCYFRPLFGLFSYQRFIEGFSTLAKLLTKLTEKDNKFVLGED